MLLVQGLAYSGHLLLNSDILRPDTVKPRTNEVQRKAPTFRPRGYDTARNLLAQETVGRAYAELRAHGIDRIIHLAHLARFENASDIDRLRHQPYSLLTAMTPSYVHAQDLLAF